MHGRHVGHVEQLDVSVRDRVEKFFRAPPIAVEQVDRTCAESMKRVDRRTRGGACCADGETVVHLGQGRWQASKGGRCWRSKDGRPKRMRMARENTKRKSGRTSIGTTGLGNCQTVGRNHTRRGGERAPQLPCLLTRPYAEEFIRKAETIRDKCSTHRS